MTATTEATTEEEWRMAREAVALGMTIREAAERYGIPYERAKKRAQRDQWPTRDRIIAAAPAGVPNAREIVAQSWAEQGEQHRRRIMGIVNRALEGANLPAPENWADLERAARIGDRAAGLEKQAPAITLAFPIAGSSEPLPFYEAESVFADTLPPSPSPSPPL
jgi:hypothetical protein